MAEPRAPQDHIDDEGALLTDPDHGGLTCVESSLNRAMTLQQWWEEKAHQWVHEYDGVKLAAIVKSGTHPDCFHLARLPLSRDTDTNYGFFDEAPLEWRNRPVMGLFQQTLFDELRQYFIANAQDSSAALDLWQNDLREFVLCYLIRLTGFSRPPVLRPVEPSIRVLGPSAQLVSVGSRAAGGFGFSQLYDSRRRPGGEARVGKFWVADRARIDLRRLLRGVSVSRGVSASGECHRACIRRDGFAQIVNARIKTAVRQ